MMNEVTEMPAVRSDAEISTAWFRVFRQFEYRKVCRLYAGTFNESFSGLLSTGLILLWLVSFALSNVSINRRQNSITLQFQGWEDSYASPSEADLFLWIGLGLNVIVLSLVIISISWRVHLMTEITFAIMLVSTIVLVALRSELEKPTQSARADSMNVAYLSIQLVTAGLVADVQVYYIWSVFLLPAILRWQWSTIQDRRPAALPALTFPYFRLFVFCLYALLVLPLWLLIIGSYVLLFFAQLIGMPSLARSAFEFATLFSTGWEFTLLRHESKDFDTKLDVAFAYKFATWRTAITPYLVAAPPNTYSYEGQVNAEGLPHGYGVFRDSEHQISEILVGHWRNGLPIAPFHSREQSANGGTFVGTRIGFITMTTVPFDKVSRCTAFRSQPLFGVSSTEACVSGKFYREFPDASNILIYSQNIDHMLDTLMECSASAPRMSVDAPAAAAEEHKYEDAFSIGSRGGGGGGGPELEVLIFIHGYNSSLLHATGLLGQMLCMGAMPAHILPVVFNWPGGALSTYYTSQAVADCDELQQAFEAFVGDVTSRGNIKKVHVLAHSMGARAALRCVSSSSFRFSQVILAQPEVNLEDFRLLAPCMTQRCDNVTVYVNRGDFALWCSEGFNRVWRQRSSCVERILGYPQPSLGRASVQPLTDVDGRIIARVDLVDTSSISSNVNQIRHSFFHLSRESIEDIREVFVTGRPASERQSRLIKRDGSNVYDVAVAPLYYKT